MQIKIPTPERETLTRLASAAGYPNVERYVADCVVDFAHQHAEGFADYPSATELEASAAMLRESEADIAAGRLYDAKEVFEKIRAEFGFKNAR